MINLNNILVKCSAVLLVTCMQTSGLLAMDSDSGSGSDKENQPKRRRLEQRQAEVIDLTRGTIVMTVGDKTMSFSDTGDAHRWFHAMAGYQKAQLLVDKANKRTLRKNAEKE